MKTAELRKKDKKELEKIDIGSLNSGDRETASYEFKVPATVDSGDYKLAVKAYSTKSGENNVCVDSSGDLDNSIYQSISIDKESKKGKYIAFDTANTITNHAEDP